MNRTGVFALLLLFLVVAGTMFTYYLTREQYVHPSLEKECSEPYAYPICQRVAEPGVHQDSGPKQLYLGTLFMAVLAFVLVILSVKASVFRQANLNVTGARQAAQRPARQAGTPGAIPNNTVREDEVARDG